MTDERGPVVVGVDGMPESSTALRWAIAEARSRGLPLRLVYAYEIPAGYPAGWYPTKGDEDRSAFVAHAESLVDAACAQARQLGRDLDISGEAIRGRGSDVLLAESTYASLLVVGSRRLGGFLGAILGSVSSAVAAGASCPVVVIRGPGGEPDKPAPVVIGIDGTDTPRHVLEFGFEYASRQGIPVHAIMCWHPHPVARSHRLEHASDDEHEAAKVLLNKALSGLPGKYPAVPVEQIVLEGSPAARLIEQAKGADLVVVGARGRHAVTGMLLGSVSQSVLHHAHGPVAIVHAPK